MIRRNLAQLIVISLLSLAFPTSAYAVVAFDAAASAQNTLSTLTFSHTVTGSNTILIVGVTHDQGDGGITSVTYAGASLTKAGTTADGAGSDTDFWYKASPTSGANNVEITIAAADNKTGHAISFTGSDGTVDGYASEVAGDASVDVTSAVGDMVIDLLGIQGTTANPAVGAGQTERTNQTSGTSFRGKTSTEDGAASVAMSWGSATDVKAQIGLNINAGTQAPATSRHRRIIED